MAVLSLWLLDRAYESSAWDSTVVASSQHKTQKKTTSASALRGNLLYDVVDDMNSEELDPIEYSLREESGVTHTKVRIAGGNIIVIT